MVVKVTDENFSHSVCCWLLSRYECKRAQRKNKVINSMQTVRQQLRQFQNSLENDFEEFQSKLNLSRKNLSFFIDQQIEYLKRFENEINEDLNYLERQNEKTCEDNKYEFDRLCLAINQNDQNLTLVQQLLTDFQTKFHLRPKMIQSIPQFQFKDIHIDDFIIKQSVVSEQRADEVEEEEEKEEEEVEMESCSKIVTENDNQLDIVVKIPYEHDRKPHLICYNNDENYYLIYSFSTHNFIRLSSDFRQLSPINDSLDKPILSIGYCSIYRLFYYSTKFDSQFVVFRIVDNRIEIRNEIELIANVKDRLLAVHVFENLIYYLCLTESAVNLLGKYDFDQSVTLPPTRLNNKLFEGQQKLSFKLLDFTVNRSFICFLIQMKTSNRSRIHIHDHQTLALINSFDLIDAVKPLTIISTQK